MSQDKISHLPNTKAQAIRLRRAGLSIRDIGNRIGVSHVRVNAILKGAKQEGVSLTDDELVSKAIEVIKCHLDGIPHGCVTPTAQSQLAAAQAVLDRQFPKTSINIETHISINEALENAKRRLSALEGSGNLYELDQTGQHCS